MSSALTDYIHALTAATAESAAQEKDKAERRRQEEAEALAQRATPLTDRLRRVIQAMPEAERTKPRPLEYFAERLRGRQRMSPHRGELASALRALGWTRRRSWQEAEEGFRAYWHPPVND